MTSGDAFQAQYTLFDGYTDWGIPLISIKIRSLSSCNGNLEVRKSQYFLNTEIHFIPKY